MRGLRAFPLLLAAVPGLAGPLVIRDLGVAAGLLLFVGTLAWAVSAPIEPGSRRRLLELAVGMTLLSLALVHPLAWLAACLGLLALELSRGSPRGRWLRQFGLAVLPSVLVVALALVGGEDTRVLLEGDLAGALTADQGLVSWASGATLVLTVFAIYHYHEGNTSDGRGVSLLLGSALALAFGYRVTWYLSLISLPTDLKVWSEAPFLLNQLKLSLGQPLYGPLEELNSYPYSPGLELVHYGLLAPVGQHLSLLAHRSLLVVWDLVTVAVLCWSMKSAAGFWQQRLGRLTWPLLGATAFLLISSSVVAPHLHPDHGLMLCVAGAIAWLLRGQSLPRWQQLLLLVLLTPVAASFKLTAAGLGLGLGLNVLLERRWKELPWLALSGVASGLLVMVLWDAWLGSYRLYAIEVMAAHPIRVHQLVPLLTGPHGRLFWCALAVWALASRGTPALEGSGELLSGARRALVLGLGLALPSGVSFMKLGGRANNLVPVAVCAGVALVLVGAHRIAAGSERRPERLLVMSLVWLGVFLMVPSGPALGSLRAQLMSYHHETVEHLRRETAAGRTPLAYGTMSGWLEAGRRDVPLDRLQTVSELYFAASPAVEDHFRRLESGRYSSIVTVASVFRRADSPSGRLAERRWRAVSPHYVVEWPLGPDGVPPPLDEGLGVVILRRKAGSTP